MARSAPVAIEIEVDAGKDGGSFEADAVKCARIEAERAQDGGRDLVGADVRVDGVRMEGGVGEQEHDVGIVVGEAAMFLELLVAAGVGDADVGCDDDVGGARIDKRRASCSSEPRRGRRRSGRCQPS